MISCYLEWKFYSKVFPQQCVQTPSGLTTIIMPLTVAVVASNPLRLHIHAAGISRVSDSMPKVYITQKHYPTVLVARPLPPNRCALFSLGFHLLILIADHQVTP